MRNNHTAVTLSGDRILIGVHCTKCGTAHEFAVPATNYFRWRNGELVQNAFPEIPREGRELLVSGSCDACFNKQFGKPPTSPFKM
jgi:hypothetical protein